MTDVGQDKNDTDQTAAISIGLSCMTETDLSRVLSTGESPLTTKGRRDLINLIVIVHDEEIRTAGVMLNKARRQTEDPGYKADMRSIAKAVADINAVCGKAGRVLVGVGSEIAAAQPIGAMVAVEQIISALREQEQAEQESE